MSLSRGRSSLPPRIPWRGPAEKRVIGYTDHLSVAPGETVAFKVSCSEPSYSVAHVRLRHGDDSPAGPGFKERLVASSIDGTYQGRVQTIETGSYVEVGDHAALNLASFTLTAWVEPWRPARGHPQALVAKWDDAVQAGYAMVLNADGELALWVGEAGGGTASLRTGVPLRRRGWYFVACSYDEATATASLHQLPARRGLFSDDDVVLARALDPRPAGVSGGAFRIAAYSGKGGTADGLFDGKIEGPAVFDRALSASELTAIGSRQSEVHPVAAWDFGVGIDGSVAHDGGPHGLHGSCRNRPSRAVTGATWSGEESDWTHAPDQYAAIHFHSDDLEDARWETDFAVTVPGGTRSGIYAARLAAGDSEDHVAFVVKAPVGRPSAGALVLLPTLTYQAYANAQHWAGEVAKLVQAEDAFVAARNLLSLYDNHRDGQATYYASRLRPMTSLRPKYYVPHLGAPARLASDLMLVDWLEEKGFDYDVCIDEDLHFDGLERLAPYKVLILGSHPEYWTKQMLDAVEAYFGQGGRVMYLGGECCYWVTSLAPDASHVMEVRKGPIGSRSTAALRGEYHHSTTGEQGGMWRLRHRTPQELVGVGFTSWSPGHGAPYRRMPDSWNPRAAFIFEGVGENELIGDFGLVTGAAAGYEIDSLDFDSGTPSHALLLASSVGLHDDEFVVAVEDVLDISQIPTMRDSHVRSDIVYFETDAGGAVFSTGSIAWTGSLSHDNYSNNVSRITENVMRRFVADDPIPGFTTAPTRGLDPLSPTP
ncbi:LamG domain-containing protein [Nocardioides agariphilus]|uniref:LamG domain-containing protein n=1 Tax=Nocardioides agariphilus TaxID=433664 RepID=A0A930VPZ7_9ACTN|nr:LamG domain-containing protein [Nocardioides agariphilus]MBF4768770.1 LamG domain-containing protein [Nocardioides agariphilus]